MIYKCVFLFSRNGWGQGTGKEGFKHWGSALDPVRRFFWFSFLQRKWQRAWTISGHEEKSGWKTWILPGTFSSFLCAVVYFLAINCILPYCAFLRLSNSIIVSVTVTTIHNVRAMTKINVFFFSTIFYRRLFWYLPTRSIFNAAFRAKVVTLDFLPEPKAHAAVHVRHPLTSAARKGATKIRCITRAGIYGMLDCQWLAKGYVDSPLLAGCFKNLPYFFLLCSPDLFFLHVFNMLVLVFTIFP